MTNIISTGLIDVVAFRIDLHMVGGFIDDTQLSAEITRNILCECMLFSTFYTTAD